MCITIEGREYHPMNYSVFLKVIFIRMNNHLIVNICECFSLQKLCTGVIQFAYSCVQDHPVWASIQFWETAFYIDVEQNIKALYVPSNNDNDYKGDVSMMMSFFKI